MRMMKCQMGKAAEMSLQFGSWSRQLGHGATIDFDEKVGGKVDAVMDADGVTVLEAEHDRTVADLVRGREDLFVPAEASAERKKHDPADAPAESKKTDKK